jgi:hypothetical protein
VATEVYRFYDADNRLLYVGVTENWPARFHEHAKKAAWYKHARRIDLKPFDSREEALAEELRAIHDEDPLWNINGSAKASATEHYKQVVEWAREWAETGKEVKYHEFVVPEIGHEMRFPELPDSFYPKEWVGHRKLYARAFRGIVWALKDFGHIRCETCIRAATHRTIANWAEEVDYYEDNHVDPDEDSWPMVIVDYVTGEHTVVGAAS